MSQTHEHDLRSGNPIPCEIEIMDMRGTMSRDTPAPPNTPAPPAPSELRIGNKADIDIIIKHYERNCRGAVGTDYGTQSLEKADYIIVAKTLNPLFLKICGFVSLTLQYGRSELYIDLICTPEENPRVKGPLLLKHVEDLAIYLKCSRIKLSSLDIPFCFYAKQGFKECDDACAENTNDECAPSSKKISLGNSNEGWRMTKCTKPTQLNETNSKIKAKTYNIPRKCKF
jgi:hypothetical protein